MTKLYLTQKHSLAVSKILLLESDSNYTQIFTSDNKILTAAKSLCVLHEALDHKKFIRVNRSLVINRKCISNYYQFADTLVFVLSNGQKVKVSRRRRKEVLQLLEA